MKVLLKFVLHPLETRKIYKQEKKITKEKDFSCLILRLKKHFIYILKVFVLNILYILNVFVPYKNPNNMSLYKYIKLVF